MDKIKKLLESELEKIKPSSAEEEKIKGIVSSLVEKLNSKLRKHKAQVMMGGSFAKSTTIRKKRYDVDLFAVFNEDKGISDKLESVIKQLKIKHSRLPGSRDYFSIDANAGGVKFKIEIVPVFKIKKAQEAKNVTDVSMLHVNYVRGKIRKNPRLSNEIRMSKAFCYGQDCYGAESHIKGFSGYCLEILTIHYGSFVNLLKNAAKWKEKTVLDPEKHYKNESEIMTEINEAKLISPLILIDPVQRNRNAAAALDDEKYGVLREAAKKFLKNPSERFFEKKEFNLDDFKKEAKRKKLPLFAVEAESRKAKEDISGAKLLKLHKMILGMLEKEGYKMRSKWVFSESRAFSYLMPKKPKEIIQRGPPAARKKHSGEFRKRWKNVFVKHGNLYTKRQPKDALKILDLDVKLLKDMSIDSFRVVKLA